MLGGVEVACEPVREVIDFPICKFIDYFEDVGVGGVVAFVVH